MRFFEQIMCIWKLEELSFVQEDHIYSHESAPWGMFPTPSTPYCSRVLQLYALSTRPARDGVMVW